jgi:hypothetical protein
METIVGNNSFSKAFKTIAQKFIKDDVFVVIFAIIFAFLYWKFAPFSFDFVGFFFSFLLCTFTALAYQLVQSNKTTLEKMDWYGVLSSNTRSFYSTFIMYICGAISLFAVFNAPGNVGDDVFKNQAVTWIEEGKCENLVSQSKQAYKVCTNMQLAKKNLNAEPFTVSRKVMEPDSSLCEYSFIAQKSGKEFSIPKQLCSVSKDSPVKFTFNAVALSDVFSTQYSYTITPIELLVIK